MIHKLKIFLFILSFAGLSSCFKKDEMVLPHPRGDVRTDTIGMTERYRYQLYFDLDSGRVVKFNERTDTDLGFDCDLRGWRIILNTADFMKAADLGMVPFGQPQDTTGANWKFDKSDGNPDSLAIGQWFSVVEGDTLSNHHVYILNRGIDTVGVSLGIFQIIFDSLKNGIYYFRYSPLAGGNVISAAVSKESGMNFIHYSLRSGGIVNPVEPSRNAYELFFTQYTTLLFTDEGAAYPYLVTGVLINPYRVDVSLDTLDAFVDINLDKALQMNFTRSADAIGYDWKYYNFDNGIYTVRAGLSYVIRNQQGFYFKLRFIGFYNRNGEKGYPVIEYQML